MPSYSRTVQVPGKKSDELYEKVSEGIDQFLAKISVGEFDIARDPVKRQLSLKSKMFSAVLFCEDGLLRLDGQMSFLAVPFRGKIDEGIDRWISRTFQAT